MLNLKNQIFKITDLGAQEEFGDDLVFGKAYMVYFVSETFRFGFWGLVRPKSSLPSSKTDQNELRRLNQASIDGLRCLGVPSDPPIDISCTWTRSELFGMENLAVTSV